jgi:peptidoglycan glycosyltransferase
MAISCLVLFLALMLNVNYLQYIGAEDLNARGDNRRVVVDEYSRKRGAIVVDGEPIAQSRPVDDQFEYLRRYPQAELYANLTGTTRSSTGPAGWRTATTRSCPAATRACSSTGSWTWSAATSPRAEHRADHRAGGAAGRVRRLMALGEDTVGAVVAVDPQTGAVLAMVSTPSYNPNRLASHDFESVQSYYERLSADPAKPNLTAPVAMSTRRGRRSSSSPLRPHCPTTSSTWTRSPSSAPARRSASPTAAATSSRTRATPTAARRR